MSAEHNRLVEAWIAGRLAEGEEQKLFRLAETDADLAQLLAEQQGLNAGIRADLAGLNARYDGDALRTYVAGLSMRTEAVPTTQQAVGRGEASRSRSAGRWLVGLFLIAGTSAGIYLATDTPSKGDANPADPAPSSVETILPSNPSPELSAPQVRADDVTAPQETPNRAADNAPRAVGGTQTTATVGKAGPNASPSETGPKADAGASASAAPVNPPVNATGNRDIEVRASVETDKLP